MIDPISVSLAAVIGGGVVTFAWRGYRKQLAAIATWDLQLAEATEAKLRGKPLPAAPAKGQIACAIPIAGLIARVE